MAELRRLSLEGSGQAAALAAELRGALPGAADISQAVAQIVADVRAGGDQALRRLSIEHDGLPEGGAVRVAAGELDVAARGLDKRLRAALELAIDNVATVARAGVGADVDVALPQGQSVRLREIPVDRAAIYVPGGRAPYPSSVVMGVVTAREAGVRDVTVCAPGGHALILAACALCGVGEVYRVGGAQAVAALAYGTETIRRADVIAGPGNLWVQEAKRQVSGDVGIDGFAGPSDVFVLAAPGTEQELVALDVLAQAEHGAGTLAVAASNDAALLDALQSRIAYAPPTEALIALVRVPDMASGLALAEEFAPEHLQLVGAAAEALAPQVRRAGCVFVGRESGTAFGDYVAGSNHTLPTSGAARFASGLSARHFRRRMSEVRIGPAAAALASPGAAIARAEGFDVHAASMEVRENPRP